MKREWFTKASKSLVLRRHVVCLNKPSPDVPALKPKIIEARRPTKETDGSRIKQDMVFWGLTDRNVS